MFCADLVTADTVSTSAATPRASGLAQTAEGAANEEDEEEKKEDQEPTEKNKGKNNISLYSNLLTGSNRGNFSSNPA